MAFCGDDEKGDQDETAVFQYEESDSSDSDDSQTEKVVKRGKTVKKKKVDNNEPYLQLPDDFGASLSEEELEEVPTDYTSYSQKPDKSLGNSDLDIDNI